MKRLRFEHQGHLPINLIMLRVLKLWNPFVCSLLTSSPLRDSLKGGAGEIIRRRKFGESLSGAREWEPHRDIGVGIAYRRNKILPSPEVGDIVG